MSQREPGYLVLEACGLPLRAAAIKQTAFSYMKQILKAAVVAIVATFFAVPGLRADDAERNPGSKHRT